MGESTDLFVSFKEIDDFRKLAASSTCKPANDLKGGWKE